MSDHREYLRLLQERNRILRGLDDDDLDGPDKLSERQVEDTYERYKENEAALKAAE